MIDIACETLVPLSQCSDLDTIPLRRTGRPIHLATWHRWASQGLHGVRLETLRVGGTRCTTVAAVQRFFAKLTVLKVGRQSKASRPADRLSRPTDDDGFSDTEAELLARDD